MYFKRKRKKVMMDIVRFFFFFFNWYRIMLDKFPCLRRS